MHILQRRSISIQQVLRANGEWLWSHAGADRICMRTARTGLGRDTHRHKISKDSSHFTYLLKRSTSLKVSIAKSLNFLIEQLLHVVNFNEPKNV